MEVQTMLMRTDPFRELCRLRILVADHASPRKIETSSLTDGRHAILA
jgi:hypothetical protein